MGAGWPAFFIYTDNYLASGRPTRHLELSVRGELPWFKSVAQAPDASIFRFTMGDGPDWIRRGIGAERINHHHSGSYPLSLRGRERERIVTEQV